MANIFQNMRGLPGGVAPLNLDAYSLATVLSGQYAYYGGQRSDTSPIIAGLLVSNGLYDASLLDFALEAIDANNTITASVQSDVKNGRLTFYTTSGIYIIKGSPIQLLNYDTGETFAQFVRQGVNDWRLQIKQAGAWVTK